MALRDDAGNPYAIATTARNPARVKIVKGAGRASVDADDWAVCGWIERLIRREREAMTLELAGSTNASAPDR